ncbi:CAP domain-containing protein [Larkinella rosea]|uniref:CAP domain-containing protein n=1 Tax=Larkinella rosea TaxID=2025312 RepID=A0A3P1BM28_9BACT|nr:CAP domain-containing protein [Larkinella rosea]RRB02082.1 CAP domain-containing protein [Larkinella rosea]
MRSFICLLLFIPCFAFGQAPKNLKADIKLPKDPAYTAAPNGFPVFDTESQVLNAFNFARRQEEKQLKLPVNSLGTLSFPENYQQLPAAQRALLLTNQERTARAKVDYGAGKGPGLPLEALETHLNEVAQAHATDMATHDFFGHTSHNGRTTLQRINAQAVFSGKCYEFMSRAENIYMFCYYSSEKPALQMPVFITEQAIFSWLYQDATVAWGHRETLLIQDKDASGGTGFHNDRGSAGSEGFLGVGLSTKVDYSPCAKFPGYQRVGHVVVMNFVDPAANCSYTLP